MKGESMRQRARGRPHQGSAAMWFGVLGGGVAWTVHLLASYLLAESICVSPPLDFRWLGLEGATILLLGITLATALTALAAVLVGIGQWTTWRNDRDHQPAAYLTLTGLLLSGTFLVIILVQGLPPLILATCG